MIKRSVRNGHIQKSTQGSSFVSLKDKILWHKTKDLLKKGTEDTYGDLIALGYHCVEAAGDKEEFEELQAKPESASEKELVQFFESKKEVTDNILSNFINQKNKEEPNYALFRKYFKEANVQLKKLLLFGLDKEPTSLDLLSDIALFSKFESALGILIERYISACRLESNEEKFKEIVMAFHCDVSLYGYDVFYSLKNIFASDPVKIASVNAIEQSIEKRYVF